MLIYIKFDCTERIKCGLVDALRSFLHLYSNLYDNGSSLSPPKVKFSFFVRSKLGSIEQAQAFNFNNTAPIANDNISILPHFQIIAIQFLTITLN